MPNVTLVCEECGDIGTCPDDDEEITEVMEDHWHQHRPFIRIDREDG